MNMWWPFRKKKEEIKLFKDEKPKKTEVESLKAGRLASIALDRLYFILNQTGPRPAGSESSRLAARLLHASFKENSDDEIITSVSEPEKSYYGIFKLLALSVIPILISLWCGQPLIALLFFAFVGFYLIFEFFLCKELKHPLFRKVDMTNVHAVIEPEGDVEDTVIFTAHHDSAPIFSIGKEKRNEVMLSLYVPLIHYAVLFLLTVVCFITDILTGEFLSFNLPPLVVIIFLSIMTLSSFLYWKLFNLISKEYSPGAGDNLISSCLLTELCHYFYWKKQNGKGLSNTRLIFASFDGEECGLKGSAKWFSQHSALCHNAIVLNIDSPYYAEHLAFLTKDVNGFEELSASLANNCADQAKKMGYKVSVGGLSLFMGATDAAAAARAGLQATTLMGIPLSGTATAPYHTKEDVPDCLDLKTLEMVISIAIKLVETEYKEKEEAVPEKIMALQDESRKFSLLKY